MKKLWLASPLLLASLCLAAQTGSGSSASSSSQGSTAQSSDQNSNPSSTTTGQGSATTPSTSGQSGTSQSPGSTGSTSSDQGTAGTSAGSTSTTSSDQTASGQANTSGASAQGGKLPQTASPLPLLGLLGLGVQVQKDGVSIDKTTRDLQSDPANAQLRSSLEKQVSKVGDRPISDPATLTRVAKAEWVLGNDKGAERDVKKALQSDPNAPEARDLQSRITALRNLESVTAEVEKHPEDPAAKTQLQQAVTKASQQPTANPVALTKIANAQVALGQQEKATENVNKALKINPNLAEAKKVQTTITMHQQR